jgi:hypothetical protein
MTLISYSDMKAQHRSFFLYQTNPRQNRLVRQLDADGATLVLKTQGPSPLVYLVTFPDASQ